METLKHGTELYNYLLEKYDGNFETAQPSFGNLLWQLIINERWKENKPHCFVAVYNNGLVLGIAEHGEYGYYNTHVHFKEGIEHDAGEDILENLNSEMFGYLPRATSEIVLSSMRRPEQDTNYQGDDIQSIWDNLADIPVNDDMEIEVAFYHWPAGSDCEDIWHDLEEKFNIVAGEMHVSKD